MNAVYLKGELVWAKVSGFPWWPGVIKAIHLKRKRVTVNQKTIIKYEDEPQAFIKFVGDHTHIITSLSKIDKFCNKFHEYSQSKNKEVQKAIELAKRLLAQSKVQVPAAILYDFLGKKRIKPIKQLKDGKEIKKSFLHSKNKQWKLIENYIKNKKKKKAMNHKRNKLNKVNTNLKDNDEHKDNEDENVKRDKEDNDLGIKFGKRKHDYYNDDDNDNIIDQFMSRTKNANGIKAKRKTAKQINGNEDDDSEYASSNESEINYSSSLSSPNENCNELKESIEHLLKIRIEKRTKESHKYIIEALQEISSLMISNQNNNTYILTKDLVPVLTAYTLSNNEDIVTNSIQLFSLISDKVISESFDMKQNELANLKKEHYQNTYQISHMSPQHKKIFIDKISSSINHSNTNNHSNGICSLTNSQIKPKPLKQPIKLIEDEKDDNKEKQENRHFRSEEKTKMLIDSNSNEETFIGFLLKKIIKDDQIIQKENIDKGIISLSYFYKNVYNKANNLNDQYAYLRKRVCLKLLNIIKVLMPESKEENLKKSVLFLEYIARIKDPDFGETYKEIIDKLYIRIKELTKYHSSNQLKFNKVIYIMLNKYSSSIHCQ